MQGGERVALEGRTDLCGRSNERKKLRCVLPALVSDKSKRDHKSHLMGFVSSWVMVGTTHDGGVENDWRQGMCDSSGSRACWLRTACHTFSPAPGPKIGSVC